MVGNGKKPASLIFLWIAVGIMMAVSIHGILIDGVYGWMLREDGFTMMAKEIAVLFVIIGTGIIMGRTMAGKAVVVAAAAGVFAWIHVMFLPVAAALFYMLYIGLAGWFLNDWFFRGKKKGVLGAFVTGTGAVITAYCLLSLAGLGSISKLQLFSAVSGMALILWFLMRKRGMAAEFFRQWNKIRLGLPEKMMLTAIIVFVLIQAGKMNLAIDYDSLWYGLRSPYVLDNGNGIYENLGLLGMVYVYSKGWETLLLPLSTLPSYSFITAGSLWAGVLMLWGVYRLSRCFVTARDSAFVTLLTSATPGIMNMAISAKTDIPTLLFQVIMLYFMAEYIQKENTEDLILSGCAFLISWTMKPTALIFSTAVFGMGCLFILIRGKLRLGGPARQWQAVLPAFAALAGIWGRTMLLTGVPVNSVFSGILQKIGFAVKYPFRGVEVPNSASGMAAAEAVRHMAERLYGLFISPVSPDMAHVIFAWGSLLIPTAFLVIFTIADMHRKEKKARKQRMKAYRIKVRGRKGVSRGAGNRKPKAADRPCREMVLFFAAVYLPFLAVNITGLFMLGQVDGNYFELLYVLTFLGAAIAVTSVRGRSVRNTIRMMAVPMLALNLLLCALTNWAWSLGFTPVQVKNKGYYNHMEIKRQEMADKGCVKIWDILASDPENRVLAVGEHPQVLAFPCCIQSFNDVTGDWGNSKAVLPEYGTTLQFVEYAKLDYMYIQGNYRPDTERPFEFARCLIRNGKVSEIIEENGHLLLCIDRDKNPDAKKDEEMMARFEGLIVPEFRHIEKAAGTKP